MFKGKWTKNPVIIGAGIVAVIYYLSRRPQSTLVSGYDNALRRSPGEGVQWDTGQYVNPSRYQP